MTTAQVIAEALGGKQSGDSYRCRCPVHGGKSGDSFSVRDGDTGPMVKCWAGCPQAEVIQELRSRGLWPDATPEQKQKYQERKRQEKIEHAELVKEAKVPGLCGNSPFKAGESPHPGADAYGQDRPVPVLPGRNANGENAATSDTRPPRKTATRKPPLFNLSFQI